jgi:hypothetical protein
MSRQITHSPPRTSAPSLIKAIVSCLFVATCGDVALSQMLPAISRPEVRGGICELMKVARLQHARGREGRERRISLVGNIKDASLYEGCGCYFQLPSERRARSHEYFFRADMGRRAWMNIAGEDVELSLNGAEQLSLKGKRGERMSFNFEGKGGIRVRVRMLVTRTSTYEADYEPQRYAVTVEVLKGKRRQIIKTFDETCGC